MHVLVCMKNACSAGCHETNGQTWHNEVGFLANRLEFLAKTAAILSN
jgi:hypothetical protein